MLGFLIGTACLIGLIKTLRRGPGYACGGGGCHPGMYAGHGCGHHHGGHPRDGAGFDDGPHGGPWARGGFASSPEGLRRMLRPLFERLSTTPGQERVIVEAALGLQGRGREIKEALRATGGDTARAFGSASFDEAAMGEAFARQDAALESCQKAWIEALMKVHEALDEGQRRELARLMERGVDIFSRFGRGPYRG
jgi:hypothetical protein